MTAVTPSVDTTIFPRINFLKNFDARAIERHLNGRIFLDYGGITESIDVLRRHPPVDGALCLSEELLPDDLGPLVTTTPTRVFDLRNDCGTPTVEDLQVLGVDSLSPVGGSTHLGTRSFPLDLGPSVTTTTSSIIDLRNDGGSPTTFNLNPLN